MEEQKKVEVPLMQTEEFEKNLKVNLSNLRYFEGVSKFKSIKRAIKRGLVSPSGIFYPKRPFNNRGNSSKRKGKHSRKINEAKKQIYVQVRQSISA